MSSNPEGLKLLAAETAELLEKVRAAAVAEPTCLDLDQHTRDLLTVVARLTEARTLLQKLALTRPAEGSTP